MERLGSRLEQSLEVRDTVVRLGSTWQAAGEASEGWIDRVGGVCWSWGV